MPAVSVVIPVYNSEAHIEQTVRSALRQSFTDFEIIIVDDGSTDRSRELIQSIDGAIKYHRQENCGVAIARNTGLSLAAGEWIAFLDADDLWRRDKLAVQMANVEQFPEVAFFYTDIDLVNETGEIQRRGYLAGKLRRREVRNSRWFVPNRLRRRSLVSVAFHDRPFPYPSTVLAKKALLLKAGGFDPRFRGSYHEDFEFFARIAQHSKLHFIPYALVEYRLHPRSQEKAIQWQNWLLLLQSLEELWRDDDGKQRFLQAQLAGHFSKLAKSALECGEFDQAQEFYRHAKRYRTGSWPSFLSGMLWAMRQQAYTRYGFRRNRE